MPTLLGDARIRLRADTSGFESEAKSGIGSALGKIAKTTTIALGAATAAGGALLTSVVKTGIAYNDLEQRSRAAFTTILGSADAASKMMGQIREFGKTSPFPRQAFISATQQLLGFGFAAEDIIPTLKVINDTTAAVGGNAETIGTLTDVFAKIKSNGKITGEELNRLGAVGINAADMIGKSLGKSGEAIRKDISDGAISADVAIGALTRGMGEKFAGASENVKNTWSGAVDRVKGAARDLGSALVEPFISVSGGGIALDWANRLADGLRKAANAAPFIIELLTTGNYNGELLKILGWDEDSKAVDTLLKIRDAAMGLGDLLIKGDYTGALARAFGWEEDSAPVDLLLHLRDAVIEAGKAIKDLVTGDGAGAREHLKGIGDAVSQMLPALEGLGPAVTTAGTALGGMAGDSLTIIGTALRFTADHIDVIIKLLPIAVGAWVLYAGAVKGANLAMGILRLQQLIGTATTIVNMNVTRQHTAALIVHAAALEGVSVAEIQRRVATVAATQMTLKSLVVDNARKVAMVATTAATWLATAATTAFGIALKIAMGPIGWIILGIGALVAAVILLWKNNDTFREKVTAAWEAVRGAFSAVLDWVTGTLWPGMKKVWDAISGAVSDAVSWIKDNWKSIIPALLGPIGLAVAWIVRHWNDLKEKTSAVFTRIGQAFQPLIDAFKAVGSAIRTVWDGWIFPVFDLIGHIFVWLWTTQIKVTIALITAAWNGLGTAFSWVWNSVLKPTIDAIGSAFVWVWENILKPAIDGIAAGFTWLYANAVKPALDGIGAAWNAVVGWISARWDDLGKALDWVWQNVIKKVFDAYASVIMWVWNTAIKPAIGWIVDRWNWLSDRINAGWLVIKAVFDILRDTVENKVKAAFEKGVDAATKAWDTLKEKAKEPIRFFLETILQHGVIDNFNKLADTFGSKRMADVWPAKGFATGGYTGHGGKFDPAGIVHRGEYVFTKEQTAKIGVGNLERIANAAGYAEGGLVGLGHMLQGKGFRVSEHPAFGGVSYGGHAKNSDHYTGHAIDVNLAGTSGQSAKEQAAIDAIVGQIQSMGFKVLWRVKNHFDHLHVSDKGGGILGKIGDLVSGAWDSLSSAAQPFTSLLGSLKDKALSTPFGGFIADAGKNLITGAIDWVKSKVGFSGSNTGITGDVGEWTGAQGKLSPGDARAAGKAMLPPSWSWDALNNLWTKESGWSWSADNPSSSAYGIPQALPGRKMAASGADWATNAITQIKWGLGYIADRYGNSQMAWLHSQQKNWYDSGGIASGLGILAKGTLEPERVLSPAQTRAFEKLADNDFKTAGSGGDTFNLTMVSSGNPRRDIDDVMHAYRVNRRGGAPRNA